MTLLCKNFVEALMRIYISTTLTNTHTRYRLSFKMFSTFNLGFDIDIKKFNVFCQSKQPSTEIIVIKVQVS